MSTFFIDFLLYIQKCICRQLLSKYVLLHELIVLGHMFRYLPACSKIYFMVLFAPKVNLVIYYKMSLSPPPLVDAYIINSVLSQIVRKYAASYFSFFFPSHWKEGKEKWEWCVHLSHFETDLNSFVIMNLRGKFSSFYLQIKNKFS